MWQGHLLLARLHHSCSSNHTAGPAADRGMTLGVEGEAADSAGLHVRRVETLPL
jgi:hypothetical protein